MTDAVFNVPQWDGQARDVALIWRLTKGRKVAECRLVTNPLGAEIRVGADGEFVRSEAGRDPAVLLDLAAAWKAQFQEKGWTARGGGSA
jgi:hypothetical protein